MDTIKGQCHLAPLTTPVGEQRFYPHGKHTMALPNMHSDWSPVLLWPVYLFIRSQV